MREYWHVVTGPDVEDIFFCNLEEEAIDFAKFEREQGNQYVEVFHVISTPVNF